MKEKYGYFGRTENGGDGGDAGDPGDGGDGGEGGTIRIVVDEKDTDLLMALRFDCRGGPGGEGGQGARGGSGGPGGRGGSSCSWTTTDKDGHTHWHSHSGGRDGSAGSRGRSSRGPERPGRPGRPGRVEIAVRDANGGEKVYAEPYALTIESAELEPEGTRFFEGDRFEPGQKIRVKSLSVSNPGGMPTPSHLPVRIFAHPGEGVEPEEDFQLPSPLRPGEQRSFANLALSFRIPDSRGDEPEPYDRDFAVIWRAQVGRTGCSFPKGFKQEFRASSPLVLLPPELFSSLLPGESTAWNWEVLNRSRVPFGREANGRLIRTVADQPEGDLPSQTLCWDEDGVGRPFQGAVEDEVALLPPGGKAAIQRRAGWRPEAPQHGFRRLRLRLAAGGLGGEEPRVIQAWSHDLKVSPPYRPSAPPGKRIRGGASGDRRR